MHQVRTMRSSNAVPKVRQASMHRCGRILKVHLRIFMCHENLLTEFNNKIDLLVGSSGSGNSAIIKALMIGLGADARVTNRGKSNKGEFL